MKVVILAAGEGTRTKEFFPDTPKALLPVNGKPIVEHLMEQYKDFEILLNVRSRDAKKFKHLNLPLLVEEKPLGNAGAVKFFIKELGEKFIVTHTDIFSDLDPRKLVKAHKGVGTIVAKDIARAKEFGIITYSGDLVTGFARRRFINCGIYLFSKKVADYIGGGFQDFDKDLFPRLITASELYFYRHDGMWNDIGVAEYWNNTKNSGGRA